MGSTWTLLAQAPRSFPLLPIGLYVHASYTSACSLSTALINPGELVIHPGRCQQSIPQGVSHARAGHRDLAFLLSERQCDRKARSPALETDCLGWNSNLATPWLRDLDQMTNLSVTQLSNL